MIYLVERVIRTMIVKQNKLDQFFLKMGVKQEKPTIWKLVILFSLLYTIFYGINLFWQDSHQIYNPSSTLPGDEFLNTETGQPYRTKANILATSVSLLMIPAFAFIGAFFSWVLVQFFQATTTIRNMFHLHIVCSLILVISSLVELIYHLFDPTSEYIPFQLGYYISANGALLGGALQAIDLFKILYFVLLVFGLKLITQLNWMKASCISIFIFAVVYFFHFARFALANLY